MGDGVTMVPVNKQPAEGIYMRRVVTALVLFMVAASLVACSGGADTSATTTPAAGSGTAVPVVPAGAAGASAAAQGDIYSPTQTVNPNDNRFPNDKTIVPSAIIEDLTAGKPMLIFYYDPTTKVSSDERREIDAAIKKYRGTIELMALDYTAGLTNSTDGSATLDPETQKIELLSSALKVNTTPFIVFVDGAGRTTYKFAGYVDRMLLSREVLRATQ